MFQPDLFSLEDCARPVKAGEPTRPLDLPAILERLTIVCERPRYSFMVLNLIAQASAQTGSAGPYIREGDRRIPVRDCYATHWFPSLSATPVVSRSQTRCDKTLRLSVPFRSIRWRQTGSSTLRFASGFVSPAAQMSAAPFPSWFAPASSGGIIRATGWITKIGAPSGKRFTRSPRKHVGHFTPVGETPSITVKAQLPAL